MKQRFLDWVDDHLCMTMSIATTLLGLVIIAHGFCGSS